MLATTPLPNIDGSGSGVAVRRRRSPARPRGAFVIGTTDSDRYARTGARISSRGIRPGRRVWRGPHNLRKSLPAKETKIGWRDVSKDVLAALPARWA